MHFSLVFIFVLIEFKVDEQIRSEAGVKLTSQLEKLLNKFFGFLGQGDAEGKGAYYDLLSAVCQKLKNRVEPYGLKGKLRLDIATLSAIFQISPNFLGNFSRYGRGHERSECLDPRKMYKTLTHVVCML